MISISVGIDNEIYRNNKTENKNKKHKKITTLFNKNPMLVPEHAHTHTFCRRDSRICIPFYDD